MICIFTLLGWILSKSLQDQHSLFIFSKSSAIFAWHSAIPLAFLWVDGVPPVNFLQGISCQVQWVWKSCSPALAMICLWPRYGLWLMYVCVVELRNILKSHPGIGTLSLDVGVFVWGKSNGLGNRRVRWFEVINCLLFWSLIPNACRFLVQIKILLSMIYPSRCHMFRTCEPPLTLVEQPWFTENYESLAAGHPQY